MSIEIHVVDWDTILNPKEIGGLRFCNLKTVNMVCMMKLGWKIASNAKDL